MTFDQVVARFPGARRLGEGKVSARCPSHDDKTASLSISTGADGRTVMHCHAGCDTAEVLAAVRLTARDLFADERPAPKASEARTYYDYQDEHGKLLYQAVRIPTATGKTFRQRRPGPDGNTWEWNLKGTRRVLYHLPELLAASPDRIVHVVEGEKDADNLRAIGEIATTNPQGAGKWRPEYAEVLRRRHVVVLPDNDDPGRKHGADVARSLRRIAASVKVVDLPGLPVKGDVSDWLAAGHTVEELHALVDAAPEWTAPARTASPAQGETITADDPSIASDGLARSYDGVLEDALATQRFADLIRGRALYATDSLAWYRYDGTRWVRDSGECWLLGEAIEVAKAYLRDAHNDPFGQQFKARINVARRYNTVAGRRKLIEGATAANLGLTTTAAQFDADPWSLNVQGGTVDLRSGRLRPHSPDDKITKLAPVTYDPAATCPRWEQFLVEVLPDRQTTEFLQKFIGFCLTGSTKNHIVVFLFGSGANGKTVLCETISALLGDYATTLPAELLMAKDFQGHSCELMPLRGARWAVFPELPPGQFNEQRVKNFAGSDTLTARNLYEGLVRWRPTHKVVLAGNHRPVVRGHDAGIWRRMKLVPFEQVIPPERRDLALSDKLRDELPGILVWALNGCIAWQDDPLVLEKGCAAIAAATAEYREEMDVLAPFIDECCTVSPSAKVPSAELYQAYLAWTQRQGTRPVSDKAFAELLRGKDFVATRVRVNTKSTRIWQGLALCVPRVPPLGQESPKVPRETVVPESLGETCLERGTGGTAPADAINPLAQLGHCLRVRPETSASAAERSALVSFCASLPPEKVQPALERLWNYWRKETSPTVSAWLAKQRDPRQPEFVQ